MATTGVKVYGGREDRASSYYFAKADTVAFSTLRNFWFEVSGDFRSGRRCDASASFSQSRIEDMLRLGGISEVELNERQARLVKEAIDREGLRVVTHLGEAAADDAQLTEANIGKVLGSHLA